METSKQVERIATKIQESLQLWETIGGKKIVIEIKTV